MATRSLVQFENGIVIYRHWDGYPSTVLKDLKYAIEKGVRTDDTEYFIAGFLQQMGAKHQKWLDDYYNDEKHKDYDTTPEMRNAVLGYGVIGVEDLKDLDCGQEYCYQFNSKEVKILTWNATKCVRKFKYTELIEMTNDELYEKVKRYE